MNGHLQETLIQEIRALEQYFATLPAFVCEQYGLKQGVPLDIKFGPDIESYFVKDGKNIFSNNDLLKALDLDMMYKINPRFIKPLRERLVAADVIDADDEQGCAMDGNVVETRFKPVTPLKQCASYEIYKTILQNHADQFGFDVFPGEGHWHFSVMQDEKSVLYSHLRENVAKQIISMQRAFPAFFVKPYIAERHSEQGFYSGPRYFTAAFYGMDSWKSSECSLRFKKAAGICRTIEPRLNLQAPYQPVFLNLCALKAALSSEVLPYNAVDRDTVSQTYNAECGGGSPYGIMRGQGGYFYLLKETSDNLRASSLFGDSVAQQMMQVAVTEYQNYLASGFHEITMPQTRIDEIVDQAQHLVSVFKNDAEFLQKKVVSALRM